MRFASIVARLGAVAFLLNSSPVTALTIAYCSSENTAASDTLVSSIFQSNGKCETTCNANYAFAVVLYQSCWCTDYIPADQTSVSECDDPCPGYPSDLCGNRSKNLYGYIAMSIVQPSGTSSGTQASGGSTASSSGTSSTDGQAQTTTPIISVQTVAGQPVTITVGSSSAAETSSPATSTSTKSSSLSGGAIAGIVIGCLLGVGALAALGLWFFFFGRRRKEPSEKSPTPESRYDPSVLGAGTVSDNQRQSKGSQMSFMRNFGAPADQHRSPTSATDYLSPNSAFTDNRMKKDAVLYPNGSRHSAVSLRDEEDYSRPVLRLTNPD